MEVPYAVRWYTFSWNDVLRLPISEEVRRAEVEEWLHREGDTLGYWGDRESHVLGLFHWSWVREELRIAQWQLQDWLTIFRDLRIFFFVHESGGETLSIHVLAVQEDGADYVATQQDQLLRRHAEVLAMLEDELGRGTSGRVT